MYQCGDSMKIFKELLDIVEEIDSIYLKLYRLECLGGLNSISFFELVRELKINIIKEQELFASFVNSPVYIELREYILGQNSPVCSRIKEYIKLYDESNEKVSDDEKNVIEDINKLYKSCSRSVFLIYLSFFQEYIDNTSMLLIKERLISLKYYNAFTKLNIGEILIENQFNVPRENYIDLYLIADIIEKNGYDSYDVILSSQLEVIIDMLKQFLTISNEKYKDYNVLAASKCIEFMIRACISILSNNDYEYIKDSIFETIDSLATDDNTNVVEIIEQIIENRMLDKSRVRKLSLKPLED